MNKLELFEAMHESAANESCLCDDEANSCTEQFLAMVQDIEVSKEQKDTLTDIYYKYGLANQMQGFELGFNAAVTLLTGK